MVIFPVHLFDPAEVNARPVPRVISGGESVSGEEDVISTDGGGRWFVDYTGIVLDTPDLIRAWGAWQGYLAGGAVECLVPLLSAETAPLADMFKRPMRPSDFYADDDLYPENVSFSAPAVIAELAAGAALRATSVQITVTQGGELKGGEKFSMGNSACRIVRVSGGVCAIEPPLREAASIGDAINFDWPVVKCKMLPGQGFDAPISFGDYSEVSISFAEST